MTAPELPPAEEWQIEDDEATEADMRAVRRLAYTFCGLFALSVLGGIAAAFDVNVWAWACDVIGGTR